MAEEKKLRDGQDSKGRFVKGNTLSHDVTKFSPRSKVRQAVQRLCEEGSEEAMLEVRAMARERNEFALKFILERSYPAPKPFNYVNKKCVNNIVTQEDANNSMTSILNSVGEAELTLEEADQLMTLIQKKIESTQLCMQEKLNEMQDKLSRLVSE